MKRTSMRTLILMLELFVAVVALQLAANKPARAGAVWLADGTASPTAPAQAADGDVDI